MSKQTSKQFICYRCNQTWDTHPYLLVDCPTCGARPGQRCKRPSEHSGNFVDFHIARDQRALDLGIIQKCTASANSKKKKEDKGEAAQDKKVKGVKVKSVKEVPQLELWVA